ncbi:hypothetical protein, partial [Paenibacillus sp. oral taxon 786]|uniref:hypothetical protein n=1 Tax=Paenibacillus sp. oral taxon 786 TaxID=652715 RepID=UPI001E2A140E
VLWPYFHKLAAKSLVFAPSGKNKGNKFRYFTANSNFAANKAIFCRYSPSRRKKPTLGKQRARLNSKFDAEPAS